VTSWKGKAVVFAMIAGQILAGVVNGRTVYLSHCGDNGGPHEDHAGYETPHGDCDSGDECLAVIAHDHLGELGHDHRCRCPHFHVRSDLQRAARTRLGETLRGLTLPVPKSLQPAQETLLLPGSVTPALVAVADPGPPQALRALRAIRLLV
jgi:hypothetical protein